jgi:hypothetical protein
MLSASGDVTITVEEDLSVERGSEAKTSIILLPFVELVMLAGYLGFNAATCIDVEEKLA